MFKSICIHVLSHFAILLSRKTCHLRTNYLIVLMRPTCNLKIRFCKVKYIKSFMTKTFVIKFNGILSFCLDIKISNTSIHRFSVIWERKTNDTQSASLSLHINIYMPYKEYFDTSIEMWNSCFIIIISTNTKKTHS